MAQTLSSYTIQYIEPSDLAELLLNNLDNSTVVVDVRDTEERSNLGWIKKSKHLCYYDFFDPLRSEFLKESSAATVQALLHTEASLVVFHCMLSQERGPRSARIFAQQLIESKLENVQSVQAIISAPNLETIRISQIMVLRGGFNRWRDESSDSAQIHALTCGL